MAFRILDIRKTFEHVLIDLVVRIGGRLMQERGDDAVLVCLEPHPNGFEILWQRD
ncbi:MAG: hypothetical protein AAGD07_21400 [Planctomycetota bacterium]